MNALSLYFIIGFMFFTTIIIPIEKIGLDNIKKLIIDDNFKKEFGDFEITNNKIYIALFLVSLVWPISIMYLIINKDNFN